MPDRHESTAPHEVPPFDESDGWRRTMLYRVTSPRDRAALIRLSRMLDALILEVGRCWDEMEGSATVAELEAATVDLRYLEAFLARLGREHVETELEPVEVEVSKLAARIAPEVGRLAATLEAGLAPQTGAA